MDMLNDISDDEFVSFLQSLGVETYKLSFEWMLNDPDFAGVLKWIYNSFDHNNALSDREEYRYNEIQKKGALLSPEDLEAAIVSIQSQYPGICMPGDQESKVAIKLDIGFQEERLAALEKQEAIVKDLVRQNELIKEQLTQELSQLNSAHQVCSEDEDAAADECMALAQEIESLMESVILGIADNLDVYTTCKSNKELSRRFMTFSPVEAYRQSAALFRSHHDLYESRCLGASCSRLTEELRAAGARARALEKRLSDAVMVYVKSKADLSGEQAKLALVSSYNSVHPSQVAGCLLRARSPLELLEQEESIAEQRVRGAAEGFARSRTEAAVGAAAAAALEVRLQIQASLAQSTGAWRRALALDRILYCSLRRELAALEEFLQFAADLRQYAADQSSAVAARVESMSQICAEHATCSDKLLATNPLLEALYTLLGLSPTSDPSLLVKAYNDIQGHVTLLEQNVEDGFKKKEEAINEFKHSAKPLQEYIFSGCTKQAHCWDSTVASLSHALKHQMESVDKKVLETTGLFTRVKNGDKQNLRKLWQWFLTDPARLLDAVRQQSF